ncbi:ASN_HP2_G0048720.mRNA.1.CDS.1 [Saccharomyces cerevisiae]|nr:ASN_HP2_G0048720.mRNA.1.CDS.1 [Saccharomyces cerevisiae]CAI6775565.1 ASN_HP2_G0048720.mRNA.1.CDS.1 [Saccharomyces cerevisiae]CAI6783456.1 ASN_HP1_G0049480.mRNA.1.CDS.1 [Saccharomyces cerevisiae]CAI7348417.1 ASN_collapsed_G0051110.mRNA.1.CDS.1 [Saccharomyces cerevisiae]
MGLLNSSDKEIIKRALPKASNKIIDVTVARLYIAYPDKNEWQYTGLSGALALVDDLVGNTFFLKLVDINGHRGVIWDQELYVNFEYYQDRTFFHTFEMEECFAGLLFVDINEASHFLKRVQKRERYANRKTLLNKNAVALTKKVREEQKSQVVHGPRGESLIDNQRKRYNYEDVDTIPTTKHKAPPPPPPTAETFDSDQTSSFSDINSTAASAPTTPAPALPPASPEVRKEETHPKHSLPPLPNQFAPLPDPPQHNSPPQNNAPSQPQSNPFPFPIPEIPSTQSATNPFPFPVPQQQFNQAPSMGIPQQNRPLPQLPNRNNRPVPPPPPMRTTTEGSGVRLPAPPPPPRRGPAPPPPPHRHVTSNTLNSAGGNSLLPQATGRRGPAPPPPPRASRPTPNVTMQQNPQQYNNSNRPFGYQTNSNMSSPPPPPATTFNTLTPQMTAATGQPTVPLPQNTQAPSQATNVPVAPPPPPAFLGQSQIPQSAPSAPIPPTLPSTTSAAPPPPPAFLTQQPQSGGAPAPPPPPQMPATSTSGGGSFAETTGDAGRDALLASIRGAGGIGALRKVDKSQLDKPSVLLQEARGESASPPAAAGNGGTPGGPPASLADALAAALNKRKTKVGAHDDMDNGDDW